MTHDYKRNGTIDLFAAMNLVVCGDAYGRPGRFVRIHGDDHAARVVRVQAQ
jgi:hypothetical protein